MRDSVMTTKASVNLKSKKCTHHWMVHAPQGVNSWGTCRKCSKRKRFSNQFEGRDRTNNSDIFVESSTRFKPDRRSTYYDPSVSAAYEESRHSDSIVAQS